MNTVLFVNTTIGFSESLFLVKLEYKEYICLKIPKFPSETWKCATLHFYFPNTGHMSFTFSGNIADACFLYIAVLMAGFA